MSNGHAVLSASGASRWLSCPGSIRLSKGIVQTSSPYAEEGTAAHELAAWCLTQKKNANERLGQTIKVGKNEYEITEEMVDAVQLYVDLVRADLETAGVGEFFVEQKFNLNWLYPGLWGTNDAMVGEFLGTLRIYDLKYGKGVAVDVEDNAQLMYYGLGGAHGRGYEAVELVIVQPRAAHESGVVRRCAMSIDELERWAQEVLLPGAKATKDPNAPLFLGEHCRFCPAFPVCPLQRERTLEVARTVFDDPPVVPPPPEVLSIEELRKIAGVSSLIQSWLESCMSYVKTLLEQGTVTPEQIGFKIVEGRLSRSWTSPEEAEKWLSQQVPSDELFTKKLISPAQAEKKLPKELKEEMNALVSSSRGRQLAHINDKRPALAPAIAAFSEVPDAIIDGEF